MKQRILVLVGGFFLFMAAAQAVVPTSTWTGGGGGSSDVVNPANWDSQPTGSGDDLLFPSVTNRLVTFDASTLSVALGGTTLNVGNVTFTNATNFSLTGTGSPTLALNGNVTLTNTNVNLIGNLVFQLNAGNRTLNVGSGSILEFGNNASVTGTGTLTKTGAGTLNIYGTATHSGGTTVSEGELLVDGDFPGASITHSAGNFVVGGTSGAAVEVKNGGTVSAAQIRIGDNNTEIGEVWVHGSGSALTAASGSDIYVGNGGNGVLYVYDDGTVSAGGGTGKLHLGHSSGGAGILKIGTDGEGYFSGGVINATEITTGSGVSGEIKFATNATAANPYYFTTDGTNSGNSILISGATEVHQENGYTILNDANDYTGATHVSGGALIVGNSGALGNSTVTVNGGTLIVNETDLYNELNLTSGKLAGNGYVTSATIGSGFTLSPGFPADTGRIGQLDFSHLELAGGGILEWNLQDPTAGAGEGWDFININTPTTLDISATSGSKFTLKLISLALSGAPGTATGFTPGQSYSWMIIASDNTIGFDANAFTLDLSQFFTDSVDIANISLSKSGNDLYLNFTPVPEPSTYALLALGAGLTSLAAWRKRRKA